MIFCRRWIFCVHLASIFLLDFIKHCQGLFVQPLVPLTCHGAPNGEAAGTEHSDHGKDGEHEEKLAVTNY